MSNTVSKPNFSMKHSLFLVLVAGVLSFAQAAVAQSSAWQTATISVAGNCGQCKARIEQAAIGRGVRQAIWDAATQTLKVEFRADKTTLDAIAARIAAAGHTAHTFGANEQAYQTLPRCCRYRENPNVH